MKRISQEQEIEEAIQNKRVQLKEVKKLKIDIETDIGFLQLELDRLKNKTEL